MNLVKLTAAALAISFGATAALAQTPTPAAPVAPKAPAVATTPAPTAPAVAAPAKKTGAIQSKTAEGQACSAEADAKNLHGKERKKFRAGCMKGKTAAAAPAKKN